MTKSGWNRKTKKEHFKKRMKLYQMGEEKNVSRSISSKTTIEPMYSREREKRGKRRREDVQANLGTADRNSGGSGYGFPSLSC